MTIVNDMPLLTYIIEALMSDIVLIDIYVIYKHSNLSIYIIISFQCYRMFSIL